MATAWGIGIIGYGGFGKFLHQTWNRMEKAQVTAIADAHPEVKPEGGIRFYPDWRKMLQDEAVQMVSICTPPDTHTELAVAALQAGKHVLVEKPLALSVQDAQKIISARDRSGKIAAVIRPAPLLPCAL